MPTIQETISKAVKAKGSIILKSKVALCIVIEDLSPNLGEEHKFISRVYNDEIGNILYEALNDVNIENKKALLKEVDRYLDEENGRNPMWRERILSYFRDLVMSTPVSKASGDQKNNISAGAVITIVNGERKIKTDDAIRKSVEDSLRKKEALLEMTAGQECEDKGELEKAFSHYLKAAILGDAKGGFYVGYMFEYGEGVKKDLTSAAKWYLMAANAGIRGAQHNLGYFYYTGTAVKQDYKRAFDYFTMAAKQGKTDSMVNIGVMYENGQYVKMDFEKALKWYKEAADEGDANGKNFYQALLERI